MKKLGNILLITASIIFAGSCGGFCLGIMVGVSNHRAGADIAGYSLVAFVIGFAMFIAIVTNSKLMKEE